MTSRDYDEEGVLIETIGHAGPYFPYDAEDPEAPEKRNDFRFGFCLPQPQTKKKKKRKHKKR